MSTAESPVESIYFAALAKESPQERLAYLDEACRADPELRRRVERLLQAQPKVGNFLQDVAGVSQSTVDHPQACETIGAVIGPYKLTQQIGEGGMGTVWMAQQTEPVKRLVALKLIKAGMDSRQVIARFEAERQALALMDHPSIAKVLDAGTTSAGRPYFVMDLVKGVPITKYCDEHHLTPRQRLELFVPVCQAVQHAHQKGIIHRDLKPSNVLVALYDGRPVPKVIDFGVAKAAGQSLTEKTLVTGFGSIIGTLEYMSPEQAEVNQLDIDTRSDIYSLGVLLYELLTGSPPFSRKGLEKAGMLEMLRVIREQEPSKPSTKLSTAEGLPTLAANRGTEPAKLTKLVRGELDWIVMKALEKDRNRRYETANGLAMDVQRQLADEPVVAGPPSAAYRLRKYARKHRKALTTIVAFAALLVAATISSIGLATWALRERDRAEAQKQAAEANFGKALEAVEHMLTRVAEVRLIHVPQMELVRRDLLQDALRFYQGFLKEKGDRPEVRSEVARAYKRVADIQDLLGERTEGEAAYGRAMALLGKLLDESPDDSSVRSDLADIHHRLSLLYHSTGRWPEAHRALQQAVAILGPLDTAAPAKDRYALASFCNTQVVLYRQTGELDKAETAFVKCRTLAEELLADAPNDPRYLKTLASCHQNMAVVYGAKNRIPDAEAAFKRAIELYQQLTRLEPETVDHRRSLAVTHNNLGLLYTQVRQLDKAGAHFEQAHEIHKAVLADHPRVVLFKIGLAGSYGNMAAHIQRTRSAEESLEWTAQSVLILESVLKQDSRDQNARMFLFDALMGRAYAYGRLDRREDAAKEWRRVIEISEGQPDIRMRVYRPFALVFLGEHGRAAAEIETLVAEGQTQGRNPLLFAKVYSRGAAAAVADATLPAAERERLADKYGGRAVELLRQAKAAGLFQDPAQAAQLKDSSDLEAIRSRPDYVRLLEELGRKP